MADPGYAIQAAVAAALLADGGVAGFVGSAVYTPIDAVGAAYPFLEIGKDQIVPADDGMCNEAWVQVDVWTAQQMQGKQIANAVRAVLAPDLLFPPVPPELTVAGHRIISSKFHSSRWLIDGDPTTPEKQVSHGVLQFRFQTVPVNA